MFTRLKLENFRAFEAVDLEFSKINLFLGPNNSGKSSFLSALNLFSQTLGSQDRDVPLLLNGSKEELGTYRDIVFNNETTRNIKIGLGLKFDINRRYKLRKKVIKKDIREGFFEVEFKYRPRRKEIIVESSKTEVPLGVLRAYSKCTDAYKHLMQCFNGEGESIGSGKPPFYNFIPLHPRQFSMEIRKTLRDISDFHFSIIDAFEELEYIGPFREYPRRTYLFSGIDPRSVGIKGEKAIDLLVMDNFKKGKLRRNIITSVSKWLNRSEIAREVYLEPLTDRHYEIKLKHFKTVEKENLADVGFGCCQILPILIAGANLHDGNKIIVEQPEIHLHPKAQSELGTYFYDLAKRNIQSFIETHSEHLLLRIQGHVAAGNLKPEDIKIYYIFANARTRKKEIIEIRLNENGTFMTEWPEGFFPERLIEAKKIAKRSLKG